MRNMKLIYLIDSGHGQSYGNVVDDGTSVPSFYSLLSVTPIIRSQFDVI